MSNNQSDTNSISSFNSVMNYLFGCEFFIGVVLNSFTIIICLRSSLIKKPSFIITAFIGLANIILLSFRGFGKFIENIYPNAQSNLAWCKISLFSEVFSYNWSGWLLVSNFVLSLNENNSKITIFYLLRHIFQLKFISAPK